MKKRKAGVICDVKVPGSLILVEMLRPQEALHTTLTLGDRVEMPPQGYVVDIGPALKSEDWGIKIGDRVLLQGSFVPVPKMSKYDRDLGIVQAHDIKAVFEEEFEEE